MFNIVGAARGLIAGCAVVAAIGIFSSSISGPAFADPTDSSITIAAATPPAADAASAATPAKPAAPTARVIVTQNADYPNFDYNTLKGINLDGCKAACLADQKCRAFTFNPKANVCFMKNDYGALASAQGS